VTDREIVVCTTFRDFDGSENDAIQHLFLESLRAQTWSNWRLVVTVFNEPNVAATLEELGLDAQVMQGDSGGGRFSLTDVVLNGMTAVQPGRSILLWTTCDVLLPPTFFECIIDRFQPGTAGTSHPHVHSTSLQAYRRGETIYAHPQGLLSRSRQDEGIDLVYFDGDLLLAERAGRILTQYRFVDWGIFEQFLVGVAQLVATRLVNIWSVGRVHKIGNDRVPRKETVEYLKTSWERNSRVLSEFIENEGASPLLRDLDYCHRSFSVQNRPRYYAQFLRFHGRRFAGSLFVRASARGDVDG